MSASINNTKKILNIYSLTKRQLNIRLLNEGKNINS